MSKGVCIVNIHFDLYFWTTPRMSLKGHLRVYNLTMQWDIVPQTKSYMFNLPHLIEVYLTVSGFNSLHAG